jgi:inward rectifier potassium channel
MSEETKQTMPRMVSRERGRGIVRLGEEERWRDVYHVMLTMSWPRFLGCMAAGYIAANVVFALLYLAGDGAIGHARPGSFADAFFFSVQTIATIGYGAMFPRTIYANIIVTGETLFGMMSLALAAGLVFARFSRPTARVLFSGVAVIAPYDGAPTLMFRAANRRHNQILEAQVSVAMVRNERTAEGTAMRRFHDLKLARGRNPVFSLTWTVLHPIDESSPLYGCTPEELAAAQIEIVVMLTGIDETFAQAIHARHSFVAEDLRWNARFADILGYAPDGRRTIDFRRFDEVVAIET